MKKLGRLYLGYAGFVGGPLFLLMVVATQAAHSEAEAVAAVLLGLVTPIPMIAVGIAVYRRWRVAPLLSSATPFALGFMVSRVWGQPQPSRAAGAMKAFLFNLDYSQLYYLPGAIGLGALVVRHVLRRRLSDARAAD